MSNRAQKIQTGQTGLRPSAQLTEKHLQASGHNAMGGRTNGS